jgi:hypothetical protein
MVNTIDVHKRGVEIVCKKLKVIGIDCEIFDETNLKDEGSIFDIIAKKNDREMKIRVCATLARDSEYKYSLSEHQKPFPNLCYAFVLLKNAKGKPDIMTFSSEYVFYHPCKANKKNGPQCFRFYADYDGHDMRDDYAKAKNNFRIINKFLKKRKNSNESLK